MSKLLISAVRLYQLCISPLFPSRCRFTPTCSEYFIQAVEKKGLIKGICLGIKRLLSCHPFNPGGYDPVE
ncbi:membrane protein insertion efficiency factor YidD [Candidatus Calescamantes bacterium]|nr:membrane protein insertion efficiency factor YidD [Candidatus Calescamantes bacterium]